MTETRRPLTTDDAIDAALAALAAAPADARLGDPRFWRYSDHVDARYAGTAGWELRMIVTYSDVADRLTPAEVARTRRAEQLEVIRAWRKAYYDDKRPRPSDVARPPTPSTRPGADDEPAADDRTRCLGCLHPRHEGKVCPKCECRR